MKHTKFLHLFFIVDDQSGLRIIYNKDADEISDPPNPGGGFFAVKHRISVLHLIPPNAPSYKASGLCTSECTSKVKKQLPLKF